MVRVPAAALAAALVAALLCGAAAQTNCPASCDLPQCPCYKAQVNHQDGTMYRPPGCTAQALPDGNIDPSDPETIFDATICRIPDSMYPEPASKNTPHQIHVQPADTTYTYFYIVWATGYALDLLPEVPTTVTYNKGNGVPATTTDAQSYVWISTTQSQASGRTAAPVTGNDARRVYTSEDTQYHSPLLHTVKVGPLVPKTTYYYVVGDPNLASQSGVSPVISFKTPPAVGASYPFRYGHIADLGQTLNSSVTLSHLKAAKPAAIMLHGDLSYADDYQFDNRVGYQPRWDVWGRFTQSTFSTIPIATCMGNHEEESEFIYGDDTTKLTACNYNSNNCAKSYRNRYPTPFAASGSTSPYWYSYNLGPAHVIHLGQYSPSCNSNSKISLSCPLGPLLESAQSKWLKTDLANVDRTKTPWLFVSFHEPYYSTAGTYGQATYFQQNFESLFYQYGVDVIFTGHVHAYERTYPVYQSNIDECAPVYICIGDGGNEEGPSEYSATTPAAWSAFRESSFGHGLLDVNSSTKAVWSWVRNQDAVATMADSVTIQRPTSCANRKPATG